MDGSGKTTYGYSALHTAVISRNLKVVQALTKRADHTGRSLLDSRDSMGFTPLHLAAMQGSRELIEMLLKAGCDVNSRTKVSHRIKETCLQLVCTEKSCRCNGIIYVSFARSTFDIRLVLLVLTQVISCHVFQPKRNRKLAYEYNSVP